MILLITRDTPRDRFFAKKVQEVLDIEVFLLHFQLPDKNRKRSSQEEKIDNLLHHLRQRSVKRIFEKEEYDIPDYEYKRFFSLEEMYRYIKQEGVSIKLFVFMNAPIAEKKFLQLATYGGINIHRSYLPYYKGPNAEFWQQLNSELDNVGVTIHVTDSGVDTGNIIMQKHLIVKEGEHFYDLQNRNYLLSVHLLVQALEKIFEFNNFSFKQPKIKKDKVYKFKDFNLNAKIEYLKKVDFENKEKTVKLFDLEKL